MIAGALAAIMHGVVHFAFTTTGSRTITQFRDRRIAKRNAHVQQRSVEFIIRCKARLT